MAEAEGSWRPPRRVRARRRARERRVGRQPQLRPPGAEPPAGGVERRPGGDQDRFPRQTVRQTSPIVPGQEEVPPQVLGDHPFPFAPALHQDRFDQRGDRARKRSAHRRRMDQQRRAAQFTLQLVQPPPAPPSPVSPRPATDRARPPLRARSQFPSVRGRTRAKGIGPRRCGTPTATDDEDRTAAGREAASARLRGRISRMERAAARREPRRSARRSSRSPSTRARSATADFREDQPATCLRRSGTPATAAGPRAAPLGIVPFPGEKAACGITGPPRTARPRRSAPGIRGSRRGRRRATCAGWQCTR